MANVDPNQPIHPSLHDRISVKVEGQLPQFVKQDHETFVAFLEAYYEYMEQTGKPYEIVGNLSNYHNLDATTTDFLNYFKKQFAEDIPEAVFANANKPFVLKHIRDFYRSKGSEKAFQFLFRLLYKEEISFYYPGKDMLRTSDGNYGKSEIIRVTDVSCCDSVFDLTGITVTGSGSGATALVEMVIKEQIGGFAVSTVYLSNVVGTFVNADTITDGTYNYPLSNMIIDTTITNSGSGYSVNDQPTLTGGGAGQGGTVSVTELTGGSIKTATINSGGTGYKVGEKLILNNTNKMRADGRGASVLVNMVDESGTILSVDIENAGSGYTEVPTVSGMDSGSGTGANITFPTTGTTIGGIKKLSIINPGYKYDPAPTLNFTAKGDGNAAATATVGAYEDEHGRAFIGTDGFLSSNKYIQDSFYYQLFSYEISAGSTIDKWRDIVKRVAHPAGLALFGNYQLVSNIDMTLAITGLSIPVDERYTLIFHDGTIDPAFVLDLKLETCDAFQNIKVNNPSEDYMLDNNDFAVEDRPADDFGLITDSLITFSVDYQLITQATFYIKPTKCQTYEKDLGIEKLRTSSGWDDYLLTTTTPTRHGDDGLVTEAGGDEDEDWGNVLDDILAETQFRLGPVRRTFERQKFHQYGGFSQDIDSVNIIHRIAVYDQGTGYTSVPTVTISGGGGSGATATAVLTAQKVTSITITNAGTGYTTFPTVTISGGGGSGATATAIMMRPSGPIIEHFKDQTVPYYNVFGGIKSIIAMNTIVTQYKTSYENNGTRNVALPPSI
tara:strand:- start:4791 stop:7133 length:2343 start_codon:yes stop_codon:yes gene_type:complete